MAMSALGRPHRIDVSRSPRASLLNLPTNLARRRSQPVDVMCCVPHCGCMLAEHGIGLGIADCRRKSDQILPRSAII